jgi:hypothetical protein
MAKRNWCSITLEQPSGELLFDIRVEKARGHGETIGHVIFNHPGFLNLSSSLQVSYTSTSPTMDSQARVV